MGVAAVEKLSLTNAAAAFLDKVEGTASSGLNLSELAAEFDGLRNSITRG